MPGSFLQCLRQSLTEPWQEGSRAIREAASLASSNSKVKVAFQKFQDDEQHRFRQLCSRFVHTADEEAGRGAVQYLDRSAEVPSEIAKECTGLLLDVHDCKHASIRDEILTGLIRESLAARAVLAKRLQGDNGGASTTAAFEKIYNIGDGAANSMVATVLDRPLWSTEDAREACERDIFQLYLAKLMEVGDDADGRAMKGISRLLAADAPRLSKLVDEDTVDMILSKLDYRNPAEIKSQGTLAVAKYLEASQSKGQFALTKFITSKIAQQKNEDLVLAFSAAAAVFPVVPSMASSLFLVEGFVSSLPPLLEKKARSEKVEHAALEMLSAACVDSACRDAIAKSCTAWLRQTMEAGKGEISGLAAVVLAKLSGPSNHADLQREQADIDMEGLVPTLQKMLVGDSSVEQQGSLEGLAYASVQPKVKAKLANDKDFLAALLKQLLGSKEGSSMAFGCLTVLDNLTRYPPNLSEEQKRMTQLKAYANAAAGAAKSTATLDPHERETAVTARCKNVLSIETVPVLVRVARSLSPASIALVFNIIRSLSWVQPHRGVVAQQGGVKLLLQLYTKITGTDAGSTRARHTAAQALARILTSVDPRLVFPRSSIPNETSAVRPLVSLLGDNPSLADEGPRDLLPTFEALLALANLLVDPYSDVSGSSADLIARLVQPALDDLILHDNVQIRRAATQLVPNLVQHPAGIALFADASDAAARRLHILLALSGSEDLETRKAAGGALASLCGYQPVVKSILDQERGMKLLLALLEDSDDDVVYRGVYAVTETMTVGGETGKAAKIRMKELGLEDKLALIAETSKVPQNLEMAAMALDALKA